MKNVTATRLLKFIRIEAHFSVKTSCMTFIKQMSGENERYYF
ncbi:MAG: hypothetical protein K0Q73_7069 [Paenibacillus sp.]|nr:hypothetical protein [Paenibacillus sp.]